MRERRIDNNSERVIMIFSEKKNITKSESYTAIEGFGDRREMVK